MAKILSVILLFISPILGITQGKTLPIHPIGQKNSNWCYAACTEMLLKYHFPASTNLPTQLQIYNILLSKKCTNNNCDGNSRVDSCNSTLPDTLIPFWQHNLRNWGLSSVTIDSTDHWSKIKESIDSNHPLIAISKLNSETQHVYIINGYFILSSCNLVLLSIIDPDSFANKRNCQSCVVNLIYDINTKEFYKTGGRFRTKYRMASTKLIIAKP